MTTPPRPFWTAREARTAVADAALIGLDELTPAQQLLILAPHPDDETLGCGGLIALASAAGRQVTVVVLTDGAASHPNSALYPPGRLRDIRRAEAACAVAALSHGRAHFVALSASDGALAEVETGVPAELARFPAEAVFATWAADPHPDHQAAFRIAERHAGECGAALFAYPVWGLTLADAAAAGASAPCVKLDIAAVLPLKAAALAMHRTQTTAMIEDDPQGFRLAQADIARHLQPGEPYFRAGAPASG